MELRDQACCQAEADADTAHGRLLIVVWAPQMANFRKIVYKILGSTTVITILVMWLALPLYWGSREWFALLARSFVCLASRWPHRMYIGCYVRGCTGSQQLHCAAGFEAKTAADRSMEIESLHRQAHRPRHRSRWGFHRLVCFSRLGKSLATLI